MRAMEKELLEVFEVAKKAADVVADGGGPSEVDRCVDALRRLRKIPVSMKVLVDTQVGKSLRSLVKNPEEKIQTLASDLLKHWKNVVIEETSKESKKEAEVKTERSQSIKVEKMTKSGSMKVEKISRSETFKVEKQSDKAVKIEMVSKAEIVKTEKSQPGGHLQVNGSGIVKVERFIKEEKEVPVTKKPVSHAIMPPKLSSMIKCNIPVRDKLRELLAEAFLKVPKETSDCDREEVRNILDEVEERDPVRVAVYVESAMFDRLGASTGEHKAKYRSIMFNLKDSKNIDFRRRVLLGEVRAEDICDLAPEEMASDERKAANRQIKEKALFDCERAAAPKASTDQFKCGRCGQRKTTYYQLQTRSADEPMTTFVTCVNCNNHWKFC